MWCHLTSLGTGLRWLGSTCARESTSDDSSPVYEYYLPTDELLINGIYDHFRKRGVPSAM